MLRRARAAAGPETHREPLGWGYTRRPAEIPHVGPRSHGKWPSGSNGANHVQWPASFHPVRRGAEAEAADKKRQLYNPYRRQGHRGIRTRLLVAGWGDIGQRQTVEQVRLAQVRHAQARLAQVVGVALEVGPVAVIPQWISKMQVECRGRERLSIEPDSRRAAANRW